MPFIKRKNTHQTHLEDLVLLGPDGLEELDDKIEGALERIQDSNSGRLNITTKIDGSPALFVYHTYPGYPDNGIALKGFVNGPQNVMTSKEAIDQKYPSDDRSGMRQMLYYGLELAKCIPDGECWQGDCLFTRDSKKEENILGTDYITFQPNKIIYAFSEGQPGYNEVKNADFGICFHTIYTGEDYHQSFKCDPTRLNNVPSNFYIMSPVLESNSNNFNINKLKTVVDRFQKLENQLLSNKAYESLVNNSVFMSYWNTFENANLADKQQVNINENTFIKELKEYISQKVQKDIDKLKTERGKANVRQKLEDLQNLIDNNTSVLTLLVKTLNEAANIKMLLWEGFRQSKPGYSTFYKSKTRGHFGADMEGTAVSDQDGNIVKIVDRSKFSSYNRDPDIESGWEHNESLIENYESMVNSGEPIMAINFGRMSVPTIGHLRLVKYMASLSKGVKARLYLSHQQMNEKNPLSYESKLAWCKKAFEPLIDVMEAESPNPVQTLSDISLKEDYKGNLVYCCGKDREASAKKWAQQRDEEGNVIYIDKQGQLIFKFKDFDVMVLDRIEGGSDEESVSGTKVRQCVLDDDFGSFAKLVPFDEEDAEELFEEIRDFYRDNGLLNEELLNEKSFSNNEIYKHDGKYLRSVINYILTNNKILLGEKGEKEVDLSGFLTPEVEKELKNLLTIQDGDLAAAFNSIMKPVNIKWTNLFKGIHSGYSGETSGGPGIGAEKELKSDKKIAELIKLVEPYLEQEYGDIKDITLVDIDHTGGANSKRNVDFKTLFNVSGLYDGVTSGPSTSNEIADVIYYLNLTLANGSVVEEPIYISVKEGPTVSPINLGLSKTDTDVIIDSLTTGITDKEHELLTSVIELRGTTIPGIIAVDKETGENIDSWYYNIPESKLDTENFKNAIINSYGNNYYYYHKYKNRIEFKPVREIIEELSKHPVKQASLTITQARVVIQFNLGDLYCRLFIRRKGSTSLYLLTEVLEGGRDSIKFKGELIKDLNKYEFLDKKALIKG